MARRSTDSVQKKSKVSTSSTLDAIPASPKSAAGFNSLQNLGPIIDAALAFRPSDEVHSDSVSAVDAAKEILAAPQMVKASRTAVSSDRRIAETLEPVLQALRDDFRSAVAELQATQTAAIASQAEVLRTLTEMIYRSAGTHQVAPESLEHALSGIEDRLLARMGLIHSGKPGGSAGRPDEEGQQRQTSPASLKPEKAATMVARSWEQIRSQMITEGELNDASLSEPEQQPDTKLPAVRQLTSDRHFRLADQDPAFEVPQSVDIDALSSDEMKAAILEREAFITTLIGRFRRQQEHTAGQLSPDQLRSLVTEMPEELAEQVRYTLKQMDDLARMGELELSLERARIARQVNQLQYSRQIIEHNVRQLGLSLNTDGTVAMPPASSGRNGGSRRWLSKLGFGP